MTALFFARRPLTAIVLPIENRQQSDVGTCWASCVRQAIAFLTGRAISERQLCATARIRPDQGATVRDMAKLLERLGPAHCLENNNPSPVLLTEYLAQRRPLIVSLTVGKGFVTHAVLLRGMIKDAGAWHAVVNDPNLADGFSMFVPFARLRAAWCSSLVVAPAQRP